MNIKSVVDIRVVLRERDSDKTVSDNGMFTFVCIASKIARKKSRLILYLALYPKTIQTLRHHRPIVIY